MLAGHGPQFKTKEADQLGQPLFSRLLKWQTLRELLSLLVSILAKTLLTLVRSHLMPLMLLSVWHNVKDLNYIYRYYFFTSLTKTLAGLNAGML